MNVRARYLTKLQSKLERSLPLDEEEAQELLEYIHELESLCNDADQDDVHGAEGWRVRLGLEEE